MLPLADDPKTCLLERPHGVEMIYAWKLRQRSSCNFDYVDVLVAELLVDNRQIFGDCDANVFQCLLLGRALRPAARKPGDRGGKALIRAVKRNFVFHT